MYKDRVGLKSKSPNYIITYCDTGETFLAGEREGEREIVQPLSSEWIFDEPDE